VEETLNQTEWKRALFPVNRTGTGAIAMFYIDKRCTIKKWQTDIIVNAKCSRLPFVMLPETLLIHEGRLLVEIFAYLLKKL